MLPHRDVEVAQVGFEPTACLCLKQAGLPVAYRAIGSSRYPEWESNPQSLRFKRSRSASWRIRAPSIAPGAGIEPAGACFRGRCSVPAATPPASLVGHFGFKQGSGRRCRTFACGFKARQPTVSRSPNTERKERESNPQGSRSAVFKTAAIAGWLVFPFAAAAAGVEPAPFTLTG
jgi:hypothetical protein